MTSSTPVALAAKNAGKVVSAFRVLGAVNGASARRLADLRLKLSPSLRALIDARIVRRAGAERYFLDEALWAERRQLTGRTLVRLAVATLLALGATAIFFLQR